jgi:hypothetical protein
MSLDLVLPCREGDNSELMYAARSWGANLDHRSLVVAGGKPDWLTGATHLPIRQTPKRRHLSALANLRAILAEPGLSDDVIFIQDDTFTMQPMDEVPVLHQGPLAAVAERRRRANGSSRQGIAMADTLKLLQAWGHEDPLCYDLHVPAVMNRAALTEVLDDIAQHLSTTSADTVSRIYWRTVYGNVHDIGGDLAADTKITNLTDDGEGRPIVSTDDATFEHSAVGDRIRATFPNPSKYEPQAVSNPPEDVNA